MDDITLPEGVDRENVEVESEFVAIDQTSDDNYSWKPFNPQNGRYYETHDPGCAEYDHTTVRGGLEVNCAYEDCGGRDTVMVDGEVTGTCPECGEGKMGREQFEVESNGESDYVSIPMVKVPSGNQIKEARLALEVTQTEIARYGDVSASTISLVENGKASVNSVRKVCNALSNYKLSNR